MEIIQKLVYYEILRESSLCHKIRKARLKISAVLKL